MAESMVFYKSFLEAVEGFEEPLQLAFIKGVLRYGLYDEEPKFENPALSGMFKLIRPQVNANNKRREDGKKGAEYGKLGGRPKKTPMGLSDKTPMGLLENANGVFAETPNVNVNVHENVNVNANDNDDDKKEKRKKIIDDAERKRLEERDRILEEDDYAARHEGAGEVYFEPKVKLGWVKKEEPGESYEMQNGIPKPPKMSNEDYKRMMDRLTAFKNRRTT